MFWVSIPLRPYNNLYSQVLNIVILVLYRTGFNGEFLGVGGTWNLNEEKNPDAEIVASGVIVGYLIYTLVQVVTYLFGTTEHKRLVFFATCGVTTAELNSCHCPHHQI